MADIFSRIKLVPIINHDQFPEIELPEVDVNCTVGEYLPLITPPEGVELAIVDAGGRCVSDRKFLYAPAMAVKLSLIQKDKAKKDLFDTPNDAPFSRFASPHEASILDLHKRYFLFSKLQNKDISSSDDKFEDILANESEELTICSKQPENQKSIVVKLCEDLKVSFTSKVFRKDDDAVYFNSDAVKLLEKFTGDLAQKDTLYDANKLREVAIKTWPESTDQLSQAQDYEVANTVAELLSKSELNVRDELMRSKIMLGVAQERVKELENAQRNMGWRALGAAFYRRYLSSFVALAQMMLLLWNSETFHAIAFAIVTTGLMKYLRSYYDYANAFNPYVLAIVWGYAYFRITFLVYPFDFFNADLPYFNDTIFPMLYPAQDRIRFDEQAMEASIRNELDREEPIDKAWFVESTRVSPKLHQIVAICLFGFFPLVFQNWKKSITSRKEAVESAFQEEYLRVKEVLSRELEEREKQRNEAHSSALPEDSTRSRYNAPESQTPPPPQPQPQPETEPEPEMPRVTAVIDPNFRDLFGRTTIPLNEADEAVRNIENPELFQQRIQEVLNDFGTGDDGSDVDPDYEPPHNDQDLHSESDSDSNHDEPETEALEAEHEDPFRDF